MTNLDSILKSRHDFANKGPSSQSFGFSSSHVWMWELDYKESWASKNWCFWIVVLEKTLESPFCKEIQPVNPKGGQSWIFIGRADAEAAILWPSDVELTHWKRPWLWERLKAGGEGDDRGWDGWMASPSWWTWDWASSGSLWWTGKHGMLQSMGLQRVGHDWVTELTEHRLFKALRGLKQLKLTLMKWVCLSGLDSNAKNKQTLICDSDSSRLFYIIF